MKPWLITNNKKIQNSNGKIQNSNRKIQKSYGQIQNSYGKMQYVADADKYFRQDKNVLQTNSTWIKTLKNPFQRISVGKFDWNFWWFAGLLSVCFSFDMLFRQKQEDGKHDEAGGQAQLLLQELRKELLDYQYRLKRQDQDLHVLSKTRMCWPRPACADQDPHVLTNREKSSVQKITHMNEKPECFESFQEELASKFKISEVALKVTKRHVFDAGRQLRVQLEEASRLLIKRQLTSDFEEKIPLRNELIARLRAVKSHFCPHGRAFRTGGAASAGTRSAASVAG